MFKNISEIYVTTAGKSKEQHGLGGDSKHHGWWVCHLKLVPMKWLAGIRERIRGELCRFVGKHIQAGGNIKCKGPGAGA